MHEVNSFAISFFQVQFRDAYDAVFEGGQLSKWPLFLTRRALVDLKDAEEKGTVKIGHFRKTWKGAVLPVPPPPLARLLC